MMNKNIFIILICMFVMLFAITSSMATAVAPEKIAKWQDNRIKTEYSIQVLTKDDLVDVIKDNGQEPVLNMSNMLSNQSFGAKYNEKEGVLSKYVGKDLNYDDVDKLTEEFSLIMLTARRPADTEYITRDNLAQVSEVIEIKENDGSQLYLPSHYEYLYKDEKYIKENELYIIPGSKVSIIYILPKLVSDNIVVEIQSTVANKYVTEKLFIENK